ncbi:MAG: hypothetical protein ACK5CY_03715 [Bacteroidia bacterium]
MESLAALKKELNSLDRIDLVNICARLARYKKENKELLAFLLLDADDPIHYAEKIKPLLDEPFEAPYHSAWAFAKRLRKALRQIAKYQRFTGSARGEAELLMYLLKKFEGDWRRGITQAGIQKIILRCFEKIESLLDKMDEDYRSDFEEPLAALKSAIAPHLFG